MVEQKKDSYWEDIPNIAPKGASYGWYDLDDCSWETAEYETTEGKKVEVSSVTATKWEPYKHHSSLKFIGFVTRCTRLCEVDPFEDWYWQDEGNSNED